VKAETCRPGACVAGRVRPKIAPMIPRSVTVHIALVVALAVVACDRRPPEDDRAETSQQASGSSDQAPDTDEKTDESSDDDNADRSHVADRWKAHDVHTHLGTAAYPIVETVLERENIYRVANMSGGDADEQWIRNLRTPSALTDRIAHYFTPDWSRAAEPDFGEQMADKLEAAVEHGSAGLKISKALGLGAEDADGELLDVDARKLDPLWERAGELGVPVTIHTGDPKAFFEKPGPDNERHEELKLAPHWSAHGDEYPPRRELLAERDRILERHPETTFVLAHLANNPENLEYVRNLLEEHDHVYVDTAARVAEFGRHPAEKVRKFFIDFQDRILFGSDLGVRARARNDGLSYSLFLGSVSKEPPSLEDIPPFFRKHWRYFETDDEAIPHPIPIQGDWKVHPIDLPSDVRAKIYWKNAERVVFAPWLGRRRAREMARTAQDLTATN